LTLRSHRGDVPIDTRPAGASATLASPSGASVATGDRAQPGALLPSDDAQTIAPAPAPHRVLALDALAIRRLLRDRPRDAGLWREPAFAREVDRVRTELAPIASRRALASSFGREAFRRTTSTAVRDPGTFGPVRLAYVVRWLELGDGRMRPGWSGFVADSD
jgi:hypothetical protein